jgi:lysozyme
VNRIHISGLVLSAAALVGLALSEGYTEQAVQPLPGDKWTNGFGTTENVKPGDKTTPPKALERKLRDVQTFEGAIKQCVNVPMTQTEYDAYVSLAYNIGSQAFCSSTLVKLLNAGNYSAACDQILRWDRFKGQPVRGLTLRRQREHALCISG